MGSLLCGGVLLMVWYFVFRMIFPNFPGRQRVILLGSDSVFPEIVARSAGYEVLGPGCALSVRLCPPWRRNLRPMKSWWAT